MTLHPPFGEPRHELKPARLRKRVMMTAELFPSLTEDSMSEIQISSTLMTQLEAQKITGAELAKSYPEQHVRAGTRATLVWLRSWRDRTAEPLRHEYDAYMHNYAGNFVRLRVTDQDLISGSQQMPVRVDCATCHRFLKSAPSSSCASRLSWSLSTSHKRERGQANP